MDVLLHVRRLVYIVNVNDGNMSTCNEDLEQTQLQ